VNIRQAYPSNYLKADDIQGDIIVTIKSFKQALLGQGPDAEEKNILHFAEFEKGFVCNQTNGFIIADLHGDDTDDWIGKKITLYATEVSFGGKTMMGLRVRLRAPGTTAARPTNRASEPPADDASPATPPSPRIKAWASLVQKLPSMGADGRTKAWKQALAETFPGTPQDKLTDADWAHFKKEIDEKLMEDGMLCPI